MVRPLNTSESRILIENDVSPFTRTATDPGHDQKQALDEQAVQIQVQVLTSRDLALDVAKALDLAPALRQRKNGHRSPKPRRSISLWRHRRP
jgi:uncharacterized protein involved in exopolysaccharide biosynthesis